jgi:hypothetical protein
VIGLFIAVRSCGPPALTPAAIFAIAGASLLVIFTALWVTLRICMPSEEKVITEAFRRRKA